MKSAFIRYLPLLMLALAWEAVARLELVSTLALPPLSRVTGGLVRSPADGELCATGCLAHPIGLGLALAIVDRRRLGILHGLVAARSMPCSARWSRCSTRCRNRR